MKIKTRKMTKEQIIKEYQISRSIKDSYHLNKDEMYLLNKIFELQKKIELTEQDIETLKLIYNQAPTGEKQ